MNNHDCSKNKEKYFRLTGSLALFFTPLLVHYFLLRQWQDKFFIYFFNNTQAFMEATSAAYQNAINSNWDFFSYFSFGKCGVGGYWPALVPSIELLFLRYFPAALFLPSNMLYLAIAMLGIFLSTKQLTHNSLCGAIAAAVYSCYWIVMIQLVAFELQLAVAACVAFGFYWYLRSQFFNRAWPSFMTGVFMVLALYCDRALPALFFFAFFLVPENFKTKKGRLLMVATLFFVSLCALPFYGPWLWGQFHRHEAIATLFSQNGDFSSPTEAYKSIAIHPAFLLGHLAYYFIALTEQLLGYGFSVFLILGTFLLHRLRKKQVEILGVVPGVPLAILILIIKKEQTYLFPLCIYFAIITGIGIGFIKGRAMRFVCAVGIVLLFTAQYRSFFNSNPQREKAFFSELLVRQKIPRLALYDFSQAPQNLGRQVNLLREQMALIIRQGILKEKAEQILFVDFEEFCFQNAAVFLLRLSFPKIRMFNGSFAKTPELGDSCSAGPAYLLTDKKKYEDIRQQSVGICPWKRLLPVYKFSNGSIVLYEEPQQF